MRAQDKRDLMFLVIGNMVGTALLLLFSSQVKADAEISILHGSERGTSVIEVQWDDGVTEKLLYKDADMDNGATGYLKWFTERKEAYKKRMKRKAQPVSSIDVGCRNWQNHKCEYVEIYE